MLWYIVNLSRLEVVRAELNTVDARKALEEWLLTEKFYGSLKPGKYTIFAEAELQITCDLQPGALWRMDFESAMPRAENPPISTNGGNQNR